MLMYLNRAGETEKKTLLYSWTEMWASEAENGLVNFFVLNKSVIWNREYI